MGLNDYSQKLNDKMTMTIYDNDGGVNIFNVLKVCYVKYYSYFYKVICISHFVLFYPVVWPR